MVFLEMKNISKSFGDVVANDQVCMKVMKGEIHALLGENGAGKSTLMNILYGLYSQSSGEIILDGEHIELESPNDAIMNGIGMVHQHFMLVQQLSVIENVLLGLKRTSALRSLDLKKAAREFSALAEKYNMDISPWETVSSLSIGDQQRLEILKALFRKSKLLILDEPTAVLTPQETRHLFQLLRKLTDEGLTIIFITHKLSEVMEICDSCTILRRGKVVANLKIPDVTSYEQLASLMVGETIAFNTCMADCRPGKIVLAIDQLSYIDNEGIVRLNNIHLKLRAGEIVGVAGVEGNGQSELVRCITGLLKPSDGRIHINDIDISGKTPKEILRMGVAHIPEDRHRMAIVAQMSINENLILISHDDPQYHRYGLLNWPMITDNNMSICQQYDVRMSSIHSSAYQLSGGNQQKIVVARELDRTPSLIVASHPCRGLDVLATKYIHSRLVDERDRGVAVLLISTELDEILELSDRIVVLYRGTISGEVSRDNGDRELLGLLMAGIHSEDL